MLINTVMVLSMVALLGLSAKGQKTESKQLTLFGGEVPIENDKNAETVWVNIGKAVKSVGDSITFTLKRATYNVDKHILTIFDGEGNGLSVWFTNDPSSPWDGKPNGVRLGEAMVKALRQSIDSPQTMADIINDSELVLKVEKIALKTEGHTFVKWSIV